MLPFAIFSHNFPIRCVKKDAKLPIFASPACIALRGVASLVHKWKLFSSRFLVLFPRWSTLDAKHFQTYMTSSLRGPRFLLECLSLLR